MPRFNYIYQALVTKPDDLVGLLAYGIYKQEKIDYILQFKKDNNEQAPNPDDLKEFNKITMARVSQYRIMAEQKMNNFQQELFISTVEILDQKYKAELEDKIKNEILTRIEKATPSKWQGVWQSVVGSIIYTLFIGALILFILGTRYGVSGIVQEALKMFGGA